jgi:hypothetical protein
LNFEIFDQFFLIECRERFNTKDEQRTSSLVEVSGPRSIDRETVNNTTQLNKFHTTYQLNKENVCSKIVTNIHTKKNKLNVVSQTRADIQEEVVSQTRTDIQKEETHISYGFEPQNHGPTEIPVESSSKVDSNANDITDKVEARDQQLYDTIETNYYNEMLEEKEFSDYNYDEISASYDWASPISRPRSYWEELRQEWYKEMLDFASDNDERRKLLER